MSAAGYDDQFTREERARVEALRILADTAADLIAEAGPLAKFIAGPEGLVPLLEWRQLRDIRDQVTALIKEAGVRSDPWQSMPDREQHVTIKVGALLDIEGAEQYRRPAVLMAGHSATVTVDQWPAGR